MANSEQLEILRQGVEVWNKWRKAHPEIETPDLAAANLSLMNLKSADLSNANLVGADISGSCLVLVDFYQANLSKARLIGSDVAGSHLSKANLSEADLTRARLIGANFNMARLSRANFTECIAGWTLFAYIDLRDVQGLDTVRHEGPSTIGIDTVYRSGGMIPKNFLFGAGIPDNFIEYMTSLVGQTHEFSSCFISHSTRDKEFAEHLHADLQQNGVRCWYAPHDIRGGEKIYDQVDRAIQLQERVLLVLSSASINSGWVITEISKAFKRERAEKRPVLFPVRLVEFDVLKDWECFDTDTGVDFAKKIREYFIPDFSTWKEPISYRDAFQRLLRDLAFRSFDSDQGQKVRFLGNP